MTTDAVKTSSLFLCRVPYLAPLFASCEYPWEMLPEIGALALRLVREGVDGFTLLGDGILVGQNVRIAESASLTGPLVIGHGSEIRPGAYLRGNVITGEKCVIGNSTELKNCILLDRVEVPHYNYVGDSVLGNRAHLGAGVVCSNLKSDKRNVIIRAEEPIPTGLRKCGAFVGDGAEVGCSSVLNPGTVIGQSTRVYPLTSLRGVIPPGMIVKSAGETVAAASE